MEVERVKIMSAAVYDLTKETIYDAYKRKNKPMIEKETCFVLNQIIITMLSIFKDRLKGITFDSGGLDFDEAYVFSDKNQTDLLNWSKRMVELEATISNVEFGKLKLDLESWYLQIGGEGIYFNYHAEYLIRPSQAAEQLGVSTVTLNKYIKQGLECVDTTSHNKIPKHVVNLWKDPIYAIRMQMLYQNKKMRNQSPEERLKEINEELTEFQIKYKAHTYLEAFSEFDVDAMDDPADYYAWRDLKEEKEALMTDLIGGKKFGANQ